MPDLILAYSPGRDSFNTNSTALSIRVSFFGDAGIDKRFTTAKAAFLIRWNSLLFCQIASRQYYNYSLLCRPLYLGFLCLLWVSFGISLHSGGGVRLLEDILKFLFGIQSLKAALKESPICLRGWRLFVTFVCALHCVV